MNEVKIASLAAVLIVIILMVGGYTKAQNDRAFVQIMADNMSQEGFEEYMENRQMNCS